jgi:mannose-6-phosphate isomerase-like protein (cupin superfamily)
MLETRWFTDTRMRIHVSEPSCSLVEAEAARGNMPPLHVHHEDDETFFVLEGTLSLVTRDGAIELGAGEAGFAPRGVPHTYRVETEQARWVVSTTTGGFASFVHEMSVPAERDGFAPIELMPSPEALGEAAARRGIELLGPPGALPG